MLYHSTRDEKLRVDSAQAVLSGLAPDGGLFVPEALPQVDVERILKMDTFGMANAVIGALLPDIPDMETLVERAYRGKFSTDELTPTVQVGDVTALELFHGPTSAFKDVALCMLPQLMGKAKTVKGMQEDILILTATSGDTGKAALEGFRDVPGIKICVFYPDGGVSAVQRAQMATQEGNNVTVLAVQGNFDDAQTGVKKIFAAVGDSLTPAGARLSTANSINIGRLAPQITYYFKAYADLLRRGQIQMGDRVNFCVPTGNFGDILAGYLAGRLGLPVGKLLCASNTNNVLTDFIQTGRYDRRRPLHKTVSPSMDILVSSNLERLLYLLTEDAALVKSLMDDLSQKGFYQVPESLHRAIRNGFWADFCDDTQTEQTISRVYRENGYLCDTHTATAFYTAHRYRETTGDRTPTVVLSTASPYKFPAAVLSALSQSATGDEFDQMEQLSALTGVAIPENLTAVRHKKTLHTAVIGKEEMLPKVLQL